MTAAQYYRTEHAEAERKAAHHARVAARLKDRAESIDVDIVEADMDGGTARAKQLAICANRTRNEARYHERQAAFARREVEYIEVDLVEAEMAEAVA